MVLLHNAALPEYKYPLLIKQFMGLLPEAVQPECKFTWGLKNAWGFLPHKVNESAGKEVSEKTTLTNILTYSPTHYKKAFTLAEVLITLGIIGIVAALTMPSILAKYHKRKIETGLEKFYSTFSQAIKLSEIDNGSAEYWDYPAGHEQCYDWYNKYLAKYLKKVKICRSPNECKIKVTGNVVNAPLIVFSDGSMVSVWVDTKLCFYVRINDGKQSKQGVNAFRFIFHPTRFQSPLMPDTYIEGVSGVRTGFHDITDREALWAACNKFPQRCAALIMHEGWKIPDDYPHKF